MAYLATPTATGEIINKYGFHFQKRYGQNFLIDANILDKIIKAAEITREDCVLEIGPGIGTMTQYLAESAKEVVAVEIDKNLLPILEETLSEYENVTVVNKDILNVDIGALAKEKNEGNPIKIVANLPYYITTPIIMGLLEGQVPFHSITVMVQKEVAERIQARPGTKDYGALSLAVQYYVKPEVMMYVPPTCFMPRPGVGSAVIRLTRFEEPLVKVESERKLFSIIRAAFNQRRKTLANALANSASLINDKGDGIKVTRQEVYDALDKMGLSSSVRGEVLTLEQFADLSNFLSFSVF